MEQKKQQTQQSSEDQKISKEQYIAQMNEYIEKLNLEERLTCLEASIAENSFKKMEYTIRMIQLQGAVKANNTEDSNKEDESK